MDAKHPCMGEFPNAQIGVFDYHAKDFANGSTYYGLVLQEDCLIAHMRARSGAPRYHVVRPLMLRTSSGLSFSLSREDGVYQDPRGGQFLRGGVFRREPNAEDEMVYSGASGFWSGGAEETVEASFGERFSWHDSGHVVLSGRRLGPAMQTYIASRDCGGPGGVCHTGMFYEAEGEIFGDGVTGIVILENVFSPPGMILGDSVIRRRYVGAWNGFATVFEDGSSQYGHVTFGVGPFRFANIIDRGQHIRCPVVSVETQTRPDGLGSRIEYHLANGEKWECVVEKNGTLMDMLALARKAGHTAQAHQGRVNRVGETRRARNYYGILEWFPERLVADAPDVDHAAPVGF